MEHHGNKYIIYTSYEYLHFTFIYTSLTLNGIRFISYLLFSFVDIMNFNIYLVRGLNINDINTNSCWK